jgi:predicted AAA+ superfamily ATPase
MINRQALRELQNRLNFSPAVVLLGARQVGKSTLGREVQKQTDGAIYLDLEIPTDRAKLSNPGAFWAAHRNALVILDEVQTMPELFTQLRPEIDAHRVPGRFLLMGSASGALLMQSAESLAGRVSYMELAPLLWDEVTRVAPANAFHDRHANYWARGGMPPSFLGKTDALSLRWRKDYLQAVVSRDLPSLGVTVPKETLWRFVRMLAHLNGQLVNYSSLAQSMGGISPHTTSRYLDLFCDTFLVRKLEPYFVNIGKRLVKSPKIYWRDTGLLHALINVHHPDDLIGHHMVGASFEALVINQVGALLDQFANGPAHMYFYRTATGAELDALIETGNERIGIEVKFSETPKPTKGFWNACQDLQVNRAYVVAPVPDAYPLDEKTWVVPVTDLSKHLLEPLH